MFSLFSILPLALGQYRYYLREGWVRGQEFSVDSMPSRAYEMPDNPFCARRITDMDAFEGRWKLVNGASDRLDGIMSRLGQSRMAINVMRGASPVSTFRVADDQSSISQSTSLPYGRRSGGTWDFDTVIPSHTDQATGITWRNVRAGWDGDEGMLFAARDSSRGTMYDVRYLCEDDTGNDWMLFIFSLDNLTAYRWLTRV